MLLHFNFLSMTVQAIVQPVESFCRLSPHKSHKSKHKYRETNMEMWGQCICGGLEQGCEVTEAQRGRTDPDVRDHFSFKY